MADADQSLEILIKTVADTTGFKMTEDQAAKLKAGITDLNSDFKSLNEDQMAHMPENAQLWQKYKGILEETGKETLSLREKHHILHTAIRALRPEFEGLGRYATMMFNPFTASLAGIIGAWALWNERVKEGTHALALMELPDLSEPIQQVNQLAQAQADYTKALNDTTVAYGSLEAASDRAIKKLREELTLRKELAHLSGAPGSAETAMDHEEHQKELQAMENKRSGLASSAEVKRRMVGEIKIASAEKDAADLKDAQAQAEDARKAKAEAQQNLEMIDQAQQGHSLQQAVAAGKFGLKYGWTTSFESAAKINKDQIDQADVIISRAARMEKEKGERDAQRAARTKLMEEAGKEQGEADILAQQIPEQRKSFAQQEQVGLRKQFAADVGAANRDLEEIHRTATQSNASPEQISKAKDAVADLGRTLKDLPELLAQLHGLGAPIADLQNQMRSLQRDYDGLNARVARVTR